MDDNTPCYLPLKVTVRPTLTTRETTLSLVSPCLLPPFEMIKKIETNSPRYWQREICPSSSFSFSSRSPSSSPSFSNWGQNLTKSQRIPTLFVKRKTGYLSYLQDPTGCRSILSRTMPSSRKRRDEDELAVRNKTEFFQSFSADPHKLAFSQFFCSDFFQEGRERGEGEDASFFGNALYECLTKERVDLLDLYVELYSARAFVLDSHFRSIYLMNLKLLFDYCQVGGGRGGRDEGEDEGDSVQWRFLLLLKMQIDQMLSESFSSSSSSSSSSSPSSASSSIFSASFFSPFSSQKSSLPALAPPHLRSQIENYKVTGGSPMISLNTTKEKEQENALFWCLLEYYGIPFPGC